MSRNGKKPSDDLRDAPETALVPHPQLGRRQIIREGDGAVQEEQRRAPEQGGPAYDRSLHEVWARLGDRWSSLAIVPSEPDHPVVEVGRALAQVCAHLSVYPVEFIDGTAIDLDSSSRLIARLAASSADGRGAPGARPYGASTWAPPITRAIVALESPLTNPVAVAVALAADGVVLCVRRGRDRIDTVRDAIQAAGPGRIRCVLLD